MFPPNIVPLCPRNGGGEERPVRERQDSYGRRLLPTTLPSARLVWQWEQRGGKGAQGPRAGRARVPQAPLAHATRAGLESHRQALWRAGRRAGGRRRRRRGHEAGGAYFGAVRPLLGPQGTGVTWGAGLCPSRWLSAAPELIKRLFWMREASRPPGVGRVGAACGHGNNQPHSCASTKPAAQLEVNSGRLNGRFKRRHLQARPVVN